MEVIQKVTDENFTKIKKAIEIFGLEAFFYAAYENYGPNGRSIPGMLMKSHEQ